MITIGKFMFAAIVDAIILFPKPTTSAIITPLCRSILSSPLLIASVWYSKSLYLEFIIFGLLKVLSECLISKNSFSTLK